MWLPTPVYYKLLDWLHGLNGWRPFSYRKARSPEWQAAYIERRRRRNRRPEGLKG